MFWDGPRVFEAKPEKEAFLCSLPCQVAAAWRTGAILATGSMGQATAIDRAVIMGNFFHVGKSFILCDFPDGHPIFTGP